MSYLVAIVFSLVACALQFACTVTGSNATHLRHGRLPEAAFIVFPAVPCYQLMFVGLQFLFPSYALWLFAGICSFLLVQLLVFVFRLRAERKRTLTMDRPTPAA